MRSILVLVPLDHLYPSFNTSVFCLRLFRDITMAECDALSNRHGHVSVFSLVCHVSLKAPTCNEENVFIKKKNNPL